MSATASLLMSPRAAPFDLSQWAIPHPSPFMCDLKITREQLGDTIGHVSNVEYVRWLDRAAELHADAAGYTRQRMLDAGVMFFVARHEIDYLAEVLLDDELVIATWVRNVKRVKSWRDYVAIRPRDQTVVCKAATLFVLVDLVTRRPMRIPREGIESFSPLEVARDFADE